MPPLPFALSVHHFISSVGADAGFAALIAVALLVLLYFSQARETATLRKRAEESGQRVAQLEAELAALADHVAALPAEISVHAVTPRAAPTYRGAPVPAGVGAASASLPPSAPAGVGAPALAAATRLIPQPEPEPAPVGLVNRPADDGTSAHTPSPVMVPGGNGSSGAAAAASVPAVKRLVQGQPGGPSRPGGGPSRPAQGRPVGAQGRPGGPPRGAMAMRPAQRKTRTGRVFGVLGALLLVGAVVAGVLVIENINSSSSSSRKSQAAATSTLASHRIPTRAPAVNPATVTVLVLNGTDQTGAAGRVSQQLNGAGFKQGGVPSNAADQTHTSTIVAYMPNDRRDALAVATALKLRATSVQPIDQATQQIACPPSSGPCRSAVVVTVGTDLAGAATQ